MDDFVRTKLKEWGFSDLIDRFRDQRIDTESLYCLGDQEINDLIEYIGPRSKFKTKLKLLKEQRDAVDLQGQQMSQVLPSTSRASHKGSGESQQGRPNITKERGAQQPVNVSGRSAPSRPLVRVPLNPATSSHSASGIQKKISEPMVVQGTQTSVSSAVTVGKRKIVHPSELGELPPPPKRPCNTESGACPEDEILSNVRKIMAVVSLKLESQQTKLNTFVKTKIKNLQTDKRELVGVFGRTGAGKSSLINAVVEEKDLLPSGDVSACTSVMIKVEANKQTTKYMADIEFITEEEWQEELSSFHNFHQERQETTLSMESEEVYQDIEEKVMAIYGEEGKDKKPEELINERYLREIPEFLHGIKKTLEGNTALELKNKLVKYVRTYTEGGANRLYWPLVKCVTIKVPKARTNNLLQHVTLVDLPGTGDRNKSRDQMWKELVQSCSIVWIVAEVNRAASEKEPWEILENTCRLMGNGGECQQIHFICTKSDIIDDPDERSASTTISNRICDRNNKAKKQVEREFSKLKKTTKHFSEDCFKVFTVSSKEFLRSRNLHRENTEIPKLQNILKALNDHHSVTLNYVRGAFGIVSLLKGASLPDEAHKKAAVFLELEKNMEGEFSKIKNNIDEAYNTFERCLSEGVEESTNSCPEDLRRFMAGKTFQTLKCLMKNKGTHKPKIRKRGKELNLNLKLSKHLIESIDGEFRKTFPNEVKCGAFGGVINNFSLDIHGLIQNYKEVELQLLFLQTEEAKMKLQLSKLTRECKKQSYNSLTETIKEQMEKCYETAAELKGEGAVNKIKELIKEHVCGRKSQPMFERAKQVMLDKLRYLRRRDLDYLEQKMRESISMALRKDEETLPDVSEEFELMEMYYSLISEEAAHAARETGLM